jgi:hypothetical protein
LPLHCYRMRKIVGPTIASRVREVKLDASEG